MGGHPLPRCNSSASAPQSQPVASCQPPALRPGLLKGPREPAARPHVCFPSVCVCGCPPAPLALPRGFRCSCRRGLAQPIPSPRAPCPPGGISQESQCLQNGDPHFPGCRAALCLDEGMHCHRHGNLGALALPSSRLGGQASSRGWGVPVGEGCPPPLPGQEPQGIWLRCWLLGSCPRPRQQLLRESLATLGAARGLEQ